MTIEQCPTSTEISSSPYLNDELMVLAGIHLERRRNGERQRFKDADWKERLRLICQDSADSIAIEKRALAAAGLKEESVYLDRFRSDLAYAQSLGIAVHMAEILDQPDLHEPVKVNLPLLDEVSYETAAYTLRHLGVLATERGEAKPDFVGLGFSQYVEDLSPDSAYCIARIGESIVSASTVVDRLDIPMNLTLEFWHDSLVGTYS